jgi:hypothetical protein
MLVQLKALAEINAAYKEHLAAHAVEPVIRRQPG